MAWRRRGGEISNGVAAKKISIMSAKNNHQHHRTSGMAYNNNGGISANSASNGEMLAWRNQWHQ
jgi:hypothetical protein